MRTILSIAAAVFAFANAAHADIYQWEYIDPADPSQGKQQSTTLAPDGAGVAAVPSADLSNRNLTMAYLIGADLAGANGTATNLTAADLSQANLSNVHFPYSTLTDADFTGAEIRGARFATFFRTDVPPNANSGLAIAQLYSTASYLAHDLSGVGLGGNDLSGGNFVGQNFTNADFYGATLTDVEFANAVIRGANFAPLIYSPPFAEAVVIGTGITLEQLYSTASYHGRDLSGIILNLNYLAGGNFVGQNLTNAYFTSATLTDADFTDADLREARFDHSTLTATDFNGAEVRGASFVRNPYVSERGTGITPAQLYSTASYQALDLSEMDFGGNLFAGGIFAAQNLTNSSFGNLYYAINWRTGEPEWQILYTTLTGADFTGADTRGAAYLDLSSATTTNLIWPDSHINGLNLDAEGLLVIRDYENYGFPIPITIDQHLAMGPGGTLRMVFEADAWDSTISFASGIPVTLGGTLELTFAADVNPATQVGRTFDLFDWTGVTPTGVFSISSPYAWDLSNLYTTGEVTLTAVPEPASGLLIGAGFCLFVIHRRWRSIHLFLMLEIPSPIYPGGQS
jgi:uncharacterized protein YjbI with pentapeptide repeats